MIACGPPKNNGDKPDQTRPKMILQKKASDIRGFFIIGTPKGFGPQCFKK